MLWHPQSLISLLNFLSLYAFNTKFYLTIAVIGDHLVRMMLVISTGGSTGSSGVSSEPYKLKNYIVHIGSNLYKFNIKHLSTRKGLDSVAMGVLKLVGRWVWILLAIFFNVLAWNLIHLYLLCFFNPSTQILTPPLIIRRF